MPPALADVLYVQADPGEVDEVTDRLWAIAVEETTFNLGNGRSYRRKIGEALHAAREPLHVLEALKNRYVHRLAVHHVLSREQMDIPLNQGRIDIEKCAEFCPGLIHLPSVDEVFLCGPQEMIFTVSEWLQQQGVAKKNIHFELFHTLENPPAGAGKSRTAVQAGAGTKGVSEVTVRLDGISHVFRLPYDGESVLNAALMEGVDLPYACKGGVCCTCRAKLLEGDVEMDVNYALEADELAAGFILACQSHPRTEKVVIDFDSR